MDDTSEGISGLESTLAGPDNAVAMTSDGATAMIVDQAAFNVDVSWSMPRHPKYESPLCYLMAFAHNRDFPRYPKDTVFTRAQLLQLQPQHIHDFLAQKAFNKIDYSIENGDRPVHARSSTLDFLKKAFSFFMPNHDPQWCNNQGNPTKHNMHRKLIDLVKLYEVRGEGADSHTKRALTMAEFYKELEMLRTHGIATDDFKFTVKYPAMTLWQYHLIGRVDDVCNFGMSNPKGHDTFAFALKTKVQWSKNVKDEQKCPDQILLGSNER
jgi:hypothetical protein